jgi:hypothetical protein
VSIEHVIDLRCPVKEALGVAELLTLVKASARAEAAIAALRDAGDPRDPSAVSCRVLRHGPGGSEEREVSVAELAARARDLAPHARHCVGCPANIVDAPFGCCGAITYPIERSTEMWLMSMLPRVLESTAGALLVRAIDELGYTGGPVRALRERGDAFFESKAPVVCTWGEREVSSDQLLQLLFFTGPLLPSHGFAIALFLGLLPHDLDREALDGANRQDALGWATPPEGGETQQHEELLRWLGAVVRAASLDVPLLVDA